MGIKILLTGLLLMAGSIAARKLFPDDANETRDSIKWIVVCSFLLGLIAFFCGMIIEIWA